VEVAGNVAQSGGGGILTASGVTLTSCSVVDNDATGGLGGGVLAQAPDIPFDINSDNTDWGQLLLDNAPEDLYIESVGGGWSWAGVASFSCSTTDGC
jgi:hypothetical protein